MALKLYYDLISQPCRAVFIFLKANNVPFDAKHIILHKKLHLTDDFKKINPFHTVPVLDNDGFKIFESTAILRYLSRNTQISVADNWFPKDSRKQARVDEYLEWHHHNTRFLCHFYFERKYLQPFRTGKPTPENLVEEAKDRMLSCLEKIEEIWLANQLFLAGNEISIADLQAVCELEQTRIADFEPKDGFPKLSAWMDRVKDILNPHYEEAHSLVYKLIAKNKS